jgi:hypothetical protein
VQSVLIENIPGKNKSESIIWQISWYSRKRNRLRSIRVKLCAKVDFINGKYSRKDNLT